MAIEFTGERVVPGQVDTDLWNEHFARYAFASRLARGKRVLDLGCGTGYGSAELSRVDNALALQYGYMHPPCRVEVNAKLMESANGN